MKNTDQTIEASAVILAPAIDTKLDIDQSQIIDYGISQKENNLDAAVSAMEQQLRPLTARFQEIEAEQAPMLQEAANRAGKTCEGPLRAALATLGIHPTFTACLPTVKDGRGSATLKIRSDEKSHSDHLDGIFTFDLPERYQTNQAAMNVLQNQINAGRQYQVDLKKQLANLPRETRNLKGALAAHVLGQSARGKELLEVIETRMLPIPAAPDLLALGNGGNDNDGGLKSKPSRRSRQAR